MFFTFLRSLTTREITNNKEGHLQQGSNVVFPLNNNLECVRYPGILGWGGDSLLCLWLDNTLGTSNCCRSGGRPGLGRTCCAGASFPTFGANVSSGFGSGWQVIPTVVPSPGSWWPGGCPRWGNKCWSGDNLPLGSYNLVLAVSPERLEAAAVWSMWAEGTVLTVTAP